MRRSFMQIFLSLVAFLVTSGAVSAELVAEHPDCCKKPDIRQTSAQDVACCPQKEEPCQCGLQSVPGPPDRVTPILSSGTGFELAPLFVQAAPVGTSEARPEPSFPTSPPPPVRPTLRLLSLLFPNPPPPSAWSRLRIRAERGQPSILSSSIFSYVFPIRALKSI